MSFAKYTTSDHKHDIPSADTQREGRVVVAVEVFTKKTVGFWSDSAPSRLVSPRPAGPELSGMMLHEVRRR